MTNSVVVDQGAPSASSMSCVWPFPEEIRAGQADQLRGRADRREGPGGGREDRRPGPGAGGLPDRGAGADPGRRGRGSRGSSSGPSEADDIRRGADEYAASVLVRLEAEVDRTLQSIRKGIALLDSRTPLERRGRGPGACPPTATPTTGLRAGAEPLDARVTAVAASSELTFPLAALLAEPAGSRRDYAFERRSRSTSVDDLALARPVSRPGPLQPDEPGHLRQRRRLRRPSPSTCSRCLRPITLPLVVALRARRPCRAIDLASRQAPRPDGRAGDRAADRPPRAGARADRPRGDPAGRADRPAVPAGLPGPVPRLRRDASRAARTTTTTPLDPRLEALRAFRVDADAETG